MYEKSGLYNFINCLDPLKLDDDKAENFKKNLSNSTKLWNKFKVRSYTMKLNKIGTEVINNKKIDILQIPIFDSDLDNNSIGWLLSFELNDIVRIMIKNSIKFNESGKLIKIT
jgi:hypothetical protein